MDRAYDKIVRELFKSVMKSPQELESLLGELYYDVQRGFKRDGVKKLQALQATPTPPIVLAGETPRTNAKLAELDMQDLEFGHKHRELKAFTKLLELETTTLQSQVSQLQKELEEAKSIGYTYADLRDEAIKEVQQLESQNFALREALESIVTYCEGDISYNAQDILNIKIMADKALLSSPPPNLTPAGELKETVALLTSIKIGNYSVPAIAKELSRLEALLKKGRKE